MPHLDFSTFAGQIFWFAVSFVVLYQIVSRTVLPTIGGVLEDRGKHIASDLEKAETATNEAESVEETYKKSLAESSERARNLIEESSKKAKEKLDAKRLDLAKKLDEKIKKAEVEISKINKESEEVVEKISAELAKEIANKIAA